MERNIYQLANRLQAVASEKECAEYTAQNGWLDSRTKNNYEKAVLAAIRKEKRKAAKRRLQAAAACVAVLAAATAVFHEEIRAAIGQIRYSISQAIGLESSLAAYKEVIQTSVHDAGYIVTLQEAVAAPQKLALSYTVQREDGRPMNDGFEDAFYQGPQTSFDVTDRLLIDGVEADGDRQYDFRYLDKKETVMGGQISYDMADLDLSSRHTYELRLNTRDGEWNFRFWADGADMYADTIRMALGDSFVLPNGAVLSLDELIVNDLEQRILCHMSEKYADEPYAVTLEATDEQGRTAVFFIGETQEDGVHATMYAREGAFFARDARTVTVIMRAAGFEKLGPQTEDGQVYKSGREVILKPANEGAVTWDLTQMK